jgi:tetratricopeptide (TPR) repeat protein
MMNCRGTGRWRALSAAVGLFLGGVLLGSLGAQQAGDVKSLLEQGLYSYEEGDFDAAVQAFEKAFALNPSSDAILRFVEAAGTSKFFAMLRDKDRRIAGIGQQLLKSSTRVLAAKASDPAQVRKAVDEVLAAQGQERTILMIRHTGTFGRNLVPPLVPVLGDNDLTRREAAINWIPKIGLDAVPVLQAARKHPNPIVRLNAAQLLGLRSLRHFVSLATLKALIEKDADEDVKEAALKSYRTILSELNGEGKEMPAKEHFLANAYELYYLKPHQNPFASSYYAPAIYKLSGEEVVGERVADFQLSGEMAKQALEEALELDPGFLVARVLTLCNDASLISKYDQNVAYYAKNESQSPELKALLESQKPYVDSVLRLRVIAAPAPVLEEGLLQALDDGRSDVAARIIETLRETRRRGPIPKGLVRALDDPSSRLVRTAAAIAIAHWNTDSPFEAGGKVVDNLSEAVVTSGIRTATRVMGDSRLANRFEDLLRELHMESHAPATTIETGFETVISLPPDLVLMDEAVRMGSGRKDVAPINHFVNELRKNYRSANVPILIVVPSSRLEDAKGLYESEERKVWVLPDSIDKTSLDRTVLQKLFKEKDDAKALATRVAASAAEALVHLASIPNDMPVAESVPSLRVVLKNRPDEVRLPAIRALGRMRAAEAAGDLAAVFTATENAREVRIEAMTAVGMAIEGSEAGAPAPVLKVIEDGMKDSDLEIRRASWYAFSNARADGASELAALLATASPVSPAPGPPDAGTSEPGADEPAAAPEPVVEPAADEPAAEEPAAEPAEEPAEPAAEEPAAEEPAAEEPTAEPAEEPAAEEPAAEEPAAEPER